MANPTGEAPKAKLKKGKMNLLIVKVSENTIRRSKSAISVLIAFLSVGVKS